MHEALTNLIADLYTQVRQGAEREAQAVSTVQALYSLLTPKQREKFGKSLPRRGI